ncbi:hypothetical protein D3C87_1854760 [compost metagenome]
MILSSPNLALRSPDGRRARDVVTLVWLKKRARGFTLDQLQRLMVILEESLEEDKAWTTT